MEQLGKQIIMMGGGVMLVGALMYFFGSSLSWLGNTPLDFSYKGDNFKVYFPLGTMIIISVVVSLFFRLFNR